MPTNPTAKRKPRRLMQDAQIIANIVAKTHTDWRGTLFRLAGEYLAGRSQGFTGGLFKEIGRIYGEPPIGERDAKP